jgi:hypothetical protein
MNIRTIVNKYKNLQKKANLKKIIVIQKKIKFEIYKLSDEEINELNQLDYERNNGYKLI